MGASAMTVIVAGADPVAAALDATSQFGAVLNLNSTAELKALISSNRLSPGVSDKIFLFADTVTDNTRPSLNELISKLTTMHARVLIIAATLHAHTIIEECPGAGLISGELHVNTILGAIANSGVDGLAPVADNYPISLTAPAERHAFPVAGSATAFPQQPAPVDYGIGFAATPQPGPPSPPPQMAAGEPAPAWSNPPAGYSTASPFDTTTGTWDGPVARAGAGGAPKRLGKVIVVTAPKGGTGKSSMSLNAAALLGMKLKGTGKNVCLVDANTQQADAGKYLSAHQPSIVDLLQDSSMIRPDRVTNFLHHKPQLNLSVLLGPPEPEVAHPAYITGDRYAEILDALKPNFDYIIVDTPVAELYHDIFRTFALPYADYLLVCVTPNTVTIYNSYMWLRAVTTKEAAGGMGFDENRIGIVLNRAEDGIGCDESVVEDQLRDYDYVGAIPETPEWKDANNHNRLVVLENRPDINTALLVVLEKATGEHLLDAASTAKLHAAGSSRSLFRRIFARKGN